MRHGLGRAGEIELPPAAEIGHHAGQPVGTEIGIALDQRHHARRLGLEQIARRGDRIAANIHDAATANIGLVAHIIGVGVEIGEDRIDRADLTQLA